LPIFLQAFVHEGEAHTFGDFVSHKMISFQLNALLPFADLKQLIEAVRALPAEIDAAQRAACDRFIEAADRHLAKQGNANDLSAPMPGKSGSCDSVVVDEA
jgi:hypothetical protein